jgi:hypothetical protein
VPPTCTSRIGAPGAPTDALFWIDTLPPTRSESPVTRAWLVRQRLPRMYTGTSTTTEFASDVHPVSSSV